MPSKSVSFAQTPPPTPSVKPPSLEFLRRRTSSVCSSADEVAADEAEALLHNKSVKEAVERADIFWREATSGNRAYIRNHPFLNLFVYNETVIQGVLARADTWFYLLFYVLVVCFRIQHHSPDFTVRHSSDFSHSLLTALASGMTFYLTFYNSSIWTRYDDQWKHTMFAVSRINDLNVMLGGYVEDAKARNDVMRFVNFYHHLVYLNQGGVSVGDALKLGVMRRMITTSEAERLASLDCDAGERVLVWACCIINELELAAVKQRHLCDLILEVRRNASFVQAYDSQPIPFVYYHFMNLFVTIVLFVTSVDSATQTVLTDLTNDDDGKATVDVGAVIYHGMLHTIYTMSILGMRELTIMLSDPFAHGRNSIPTSKYMDTVLVKSSRHATAHAAQRPSRSEDPSFQLAHQTFEALGTVEGETGTSVDSTRRKQGFYRALKQWERRSVLQCHTYSTSMKNTMKGMLLSSAEGSPRVPACSGTGRVRSASAAPSSEPTRPPKRSSMAGGRSSTGSDVARVDSRLLQPAGCTTQSDELPPPRLDSLRFLKGSILGSSSAGCLHTADADGGGASALCPDGPP